ncbi:L-lactate permease [Pseudoroseomonas cervicalis]|uniref:L-lactate permease n=1 Tax=Teichococcus cervicalis TaxID=204525 RepID=UPI0022F15EB4|nr:L-lactate permease [Pseudoroseomonas cervicalis]WBV41964.1 L-lactate permease [Pseudoroseomonas cervicalis]
MLLLLQAAPLLLLLSLLLSGRAGPVPACLAALAASLPAILLTLPPGGGLLPFLAAESLRGAYLALQPIGVLAGGLLFHAAVTRLGPPDQASLPATPRRVFAATLLAGTFVESVTGFAVGGVFALAQLRRMGLLGTPAAALALMALVLVPWGGLGPGTALGAALIGVPPQAVALATAWPHATWLLCLAPVFWRLCARAGVKVPGAEKLAQFGLMGLVAALLLAANLLLPFEAAGILASGLPLLWVLWRLDPPQGALGWRRALLALAPWAGLAAALLLARSWHGAPAWKPFPTLPALPITHVAVVLALVSALILALRPRGVPRAVLAALTRARRPALAMLLYVLLGRWLAGSGIAAGLAEQAGGALGPLAPYAMPVLGMVSGVVTGSNVGSNAALMPVQAALGQAAGLPAALAGGLHNFAGAAASGMSFAVTAMIAGLAGTSPAAIWRLLWPSLLAIPLVGWAWITLALFS